MKTLNKLQQKSLLIIGCITFSMMSIYNDVNAQTPVNYLNDKHASQLGKILVQDFQGRFKPFNTLASEILRKIAKRENIEDISAEAVFMSMILSPETWEQVPLIQVGSHPEVQKMLNSKEKLVPYRRFFNDDGTYKLKESVRKAQGMNPKDHGVFEKAIIKLDEKVNIANMVFSARIFRIYPLPNDENNTWISPAEINESLPTFSGLDFIKGYFPNYLQALKQAKETQNWAIPDKMLEELQAFQKDKAGLILPSTGRQSAELFLNKAEIFSRLRNVYGILGLVLLFGFLYTVVRHSVNRFTITKIAFITLAVAFVVHTIGLALRWYVSGHAPWSNGYESMIYIAWTTMLGGLIFSRKSLGGLAATCILAATILLVAGMSWLDPEITPLVPVLKSYWLTIHVSLEAGSYGFLLLGAVIGMLNLLLMILTRPGNIENIKRAIMELTIVSEITVTAGLVMVSVGTYLGGVWANESWGRYWGWDAKETWALVTILVYAFILHMRFIPKLKSIYTYNCATLFGFATVIMTYYGVNYYLSGLHSYAAGDPVPIPPVVYYTAILLTVLSIVAYINYRRRFPNGFYLH